LANGAGDYEGINQAMTREQLLLWLCALLVVTGGVLCGGPTNPILSLVVELIGCGLIGTALIGFFNGEAPRGIAPAIVFILLIGLLPLVQLAPLPVSMWRSLPGHAIPDTISKLVGRGDLSRPLSLSPEDTRMWALAFIVPVAMFVGAVQLDTQARDRLILVIVGFAVASAVLGVFQVTTGQFYYYQQSHVGYPIGFFANRNHQGDLMLIAMPLSARLTATMHARRQFRRNATVALAVFFAAAVVATQSRTALTLLPIAVLGTYITFAGQIGGRQFWLVLAGLAGLSAAVGAVLLLSPIGQHVLRRFNEFDADPRQHIWSATIVGIHQFWPAGSGLGSFVPVYKMLEDLNFMDDKWVNHAHEDYLEILLEAGLAGAILLAAYPVLLISRLFSSIPSWLGQHKWAALTGIAILMLHALTDYSLRTFGLVAIFAFFNALLYPSRHMSRPRHIGEARRVADPPPAFADSPTPTAERAETFTRRDKSRTR
jgi:O-antigen ligase